jgi:hypothetical protein
LAMVVATHNRRLFLKTEAGGFSFAMRLSPHNVELALLGRLFDINLQDPTIRSLKRTINQDLFHLTACELILLMRLVDLASRLGG